MTIPGKLLFMLITFIMFLLSFNVANRTKVKALQKLFVITIGSIIFLSIMFHETIMSFLSNILGVSSGPDSVLYLFIIVSTSINLILFRKFFELETKITRIVQNISLGSNNTKDIISTKSYKN